ncbi:MAG TPA: hypothetical protein VHB49_10215 [Bradyrhizobium sp.]|nr:hypothetical protein [Bradyrhizobium sp.]
MGRLAKGGAILLLPLALAGCAGDSGILSYSTSSDANQPFPTNYHDDLLAFFKTYLNNPVGVHDAVMAEPMQRTVGGHLRYVSCLRFSARDADGSYHEARERAVVYVDGRLDHIVEQPGEVCAGAVYAPFPDLEKLGADQQPAPAAPKPAPTRRK